MKHLNEFDEFNPDDFTDDSLDKDMSDLKKIGFHPLKFNVDYQDIYESWKEHDEEIVKDWSFTPPGGVKTWVSEASGYVEEEGDIIIKFIFNTGKSFTFARIYKNGEYVIVLRTGDDGKYVPDDDYFFAEVEEFDTIAGVILTEYYERYYKELHEG